MAATETARLSSTQKERSFPVHHRYQEAVFAKQRVFRRTLSFMRDLNQLEVFWQHNLHGARLQ